MSTAPHQETPGDLELFDPSIFGDAPPRTEQATAAPAPAEKVAPTPATTTAAASTATPEETPTADKVSSVDFAKRRRRIKQIAAVAAIAGCWLWFTKPWHDVAAVSAGSAAAGTQSVTADATDLVGADLAAAEQYLAQHGTLDGIAIDGAQLAVRGTTTYAVRTIDGTCTVYGLLDGQRIPATPDPTAEACKGQIVTVQANLDAAAQQSQNTSSWAAEDTLNKASAAAAAYASRNFTDGKPSMTGLPSSLSGALVMSNNGEYVTLRVSYPGACLETFVTAAGEIGETNTCS